MGQITKNRVPGVWDRLSIWKNRPRQRAFLHGWAFCPSKLAGEGLWRKGHTYGEFVVSRI
jgi:hypothetical protein